MAVNIEDIETLRRELEALPRHQPQSVSKQDAVALLAKQLGAAQRRGYSAEELAQMLSNKGIAINAATLRGYLQRSRRSRARTSGKGGGTSAVASRSAQGTQRGHAAPTGAELPASRPEPRDRESPTTPVQPATASPKAVGVEAAGATLAVGAPRSDKREF